MDRENCDAEHGAGSLLFRPASVAEAYGVMNSLLRPLKQLSSRIMPTDPFSREGFLYCFGFFTLIQSGDRRRDRDDLGARHHALEPELAALAEQVRPISP